MEKSLFDRDPTTIEYPDCEGPPLTDEMVSHAEAELGVVLPSAYVALMHRCNGGYTDGLAFPTHQPTSWAHDHVPVDSLYGIPAIGELGRFGTGVGILMTKYMTSEWGLPAHLVLLTGDGHWWIAMDYRKCGLAGQPTIVWVDVEAGSDLQLADSFDSFVSQLVPASDFEDN